MKKTVLITGASGGLGHALAERFAKAGCDLILLANRNADKLNRHADALRNSFGVSIRTFSGDISDESFIERVFDGITRLDLLINNAAVSYTGLFQDMSLSDWRRTMSVNLDAAFLFSKKAVPLMLSSEDKGRIINISSVWGNTGASMEAAYSASKGGLNSFTKALGRELAPMGIPVNAVALGFMDTEMNTHLNEEEKKAVISEIPADRPLLPEEAAEFIYLISQAPAYLTAQIITLDGGWT
ncbi:MAG: SDR family NAD(P)-dependent oxidoreductase [Lachnospiraceae bacterium]|nr:SDR family NAD(P)-dependent oxidoreductase [Lachnospiraceae bacterium]